MPLFAQNLFSKAPETSEELGRLSIDQQLVHYGALPIYQKLKIWIAGTFMVTTDAIHIYIGFGCFVLSAVVLQIPPTRWRVLLLGLLASVGMEIVDLYYDFGSLGFFRALASLHDLVNTNLIPIVLVIILKAGEQVRSAKALSGPSRVFSQDAQQVPAGGVPESVHSQALPSALGETFQGSKDRRS